MFPSPPLYILMNDFLIGRPFCLNIQIISGLLFLAVNDGFFKVLSIFTANQLISMARRRQGIQQH